MDTGQILVDTSSLLLLIRIAPHMFTEDKYGCCTIKEVRNEFFLNTLKFCSKYPWREQYNDRIACLPDDISDSPHVRQYQEAISCLIDAGISKDGGGFFDLSPVDKQLLACSLGNGLMISTCDQPLEDFAKQEFSGEFKGSVSPLGVLNSWLKRGIVAMTDSIYAVISDWRSCQEPAQPGRQKRTFESLTKRPYTGP